MQTKTGVMVIETTITSTKFDTALKSATLSTASFPTILSLLLVGWLLFDKYTPFPT